MRILEIKTVLYTWELTADEDARVVAGLRALGADPIAERLLAQRGIGAPSPETPAPPLPSGATPTHPNATDEELARAQINEEPLVLTEEQKQRRATATAAMGIWGHGAPALPVGNDF